MLGFSAAVSGSFSLGAMVANDIAPAALTTVRFALAFALLAVLVSSVRGQGRGGRHGFARADFAAPWRYGVLAVLYGGYFILMFEGLKTAHPVSAGAVFTLIPLMTAAVAWPLLGQRLSPWIALALLIGAVGALWVIFRGDVQAMMGFAVGTGEGIYFLGCILHALYAPMLRRLHRGESAMVTAALVTLAGVFVVGAYGWADIRATDWTALPVLVWITLGYLTVVATAFTTSALQFAAQRLPSSKVMAYTYLTPVWVILWEAALRHGLPGGVVVPGVVLIIAALLLLLRAD